MNSIIESLNAWGAKLLEFALPMLWQSSLLIAVVFALDFALRRKLRAAVRYALWLVVLVKLLLPPALALPSSAAWWIRNRPAPPRPVTRTFTVSFVDPAPAESEPVRAIPVLPPAPPVRLSTTGWMFLASASGALLLLAYLLFRWSRIIRQVRQAPVAKDQITKLFDSKSDVRCSAFEVSGRIRLTSEPISPAVCGLFRPIILLPESLVQKLRPEQLRAVLLHEFIHLRRGDVWVNLAQSLLQIVYWWHPLLWLANARIRRVREEAVDDAVMLALKGDSEIYAPTLLEVAKLAFNRPLASLGLVGILESKNALRQRIERLVNFTTPGRAGLSVASLCAIAAFTAVAVPMGEPPERIADSGQPAVASPAADPAGLIPYHAKVDPEVFIRNIKARASETMHTTNEQWGEILLSILDGYGIDCSHGLALNTQTGEFTTQNTPEALQTLDQVIKELNLPGGERILNPPYGLKRVLISGKFYQMRSSDFAQLNLDSHHKYQQPNMTPWWNLSSDEVDQIAQHIKGLGGQLLSSPRIDTAHGILAGLSVGNKTSGIELQCSPSIGDGAVNLTVLARTRGIFTSDGSDWPDFAGWTNCAIFSRLGIEDGNGVILRAENPGNNPENNLVVILQAKILEPSTASSPPAATQKDPPSGTPDPAPASDANVVQGFTVNRYEVIGNTLLSDETLKSILAPYTGTIVSFGEIARAASDLQMEYKKRGYPKVSVTVPMQKLTNGIVKLQVFNPAAIRAQTSDGPASGEVHNPASPPQPNLYARTNVIYTSAERQKIFQKLNAIKFEKIDFPNLPLSEVVRILSEQTRRRDPEREGINFIVSKANDVDLSAVTINLDPAITNMRLADVLDAIVHTADHPIKYAILDYGVEFSLRDSDSNTLTPPSEDLADSLNKATFTSPQQQKIFHKLNNLAFDSVHFPDFSLGEVISNLAEMVRRRDPTLEGVNFIIDESPPNNTPNLKLKEVRIWLDPPLRRVTLMDVLEGIVKTANYPIKFSLRDDGVAFQFRSNSDKQSGQFSSNAVAQTTPGQPELLTRTFRVDPNTFYRGVEGLLAKAGAPQNGDVPRAGTVGLAPNGTRYITASGPPIDVQSRVQSKFFALALTAGVDLSPPKFIAFDDRKGTLTVRATASDLAAVEKLVGQANTPPPEVTIRARFIEMPATIDASGHIKPVANAVTRLLKNVLTNHVAFASNAPDLMMGTLSEANMKTLLSLLKDKSAGDLLNEGQITTLSGRQAQFEVVNVSTIVNGVKLTPTNVDYQTENEPFGTTLDVLPTFAEGEHAVSLKLTPTVTEFLGYEYTDSISAHDQVLKNAPVKAQLPLPKSRVRTATATATVPDGQTLVMANLSDNVIIGGDRAPMVEATFSSRSYKELVVFVTPTLIDPAGNRLYAATSGKPDNNSISVSGAVHSKDYYDGPIQ